MASQNTNLLSSTVPQYQAIESHDEKDLSHSQDIELGRPSNCACFVQKPAFRESWPATFRHSASLLVRAAPTQMELSKNVCFASYRDRHRTPSFKRVSRPMMMGQRSRGYSDDAPILRVKLPMYDAKLSDITWLHKGTQYAAIKQTLKKESKKQKQQKMKKLHPKGAGEEVDAHKVFHNHPTVRKFRDEYSNWRKGAAKGASGELTNDRLDGYTVGGEEAEVSDEVELPEEQIKLIEDTISRGAMSVVEEEPSPFIINLDNLAEIPPFEPTLLNQSEPQPLEFKTESSESLVVLNKCQPEAPKGVTLTQAVFNCLNANFGVTILVMPYAMSQIGFLFIPMILLIVLVCLHTMDLLDRCQHRTGSLSFPDIATAAFGSTGRRLAAVMCYFDLYAAGVGCMIITAHSLDMIVFALTGYLMGDAKSKIITAIAYVPTCFLRDLSVVSYLSIGGLVAVLVAMALIMLSVSSEDAPTETDSKLVGPNPFIPVSLILYQFCMHSLYPSLRASMARPTEAPLMSRLVLAIVAILVTIFSTFIYVVLGAQVPEIITSELGTSLMGVAVNMMVLLSGVSKLPLSLFSLSDAFTELYTAKTKHHLKSPGPAHKSGVRVSSTPLLRAQVLSVLLLTCVFVQGFAPLLQLVCWVFTPLVMVILPIACYLTLFNKHEVSPTIRVLYQSLVVVVTAFGLIGVETICAHALNL